jgi:hypothetical protein
MKDKILITELSDKELNCEVLKYAIHSDDVMPRTTDFSNTTDFANDLNAMNQVENTVLRERSQYTEFVECIANMRSGHHSVVSASARQRARAFVLVMAPDKFNNHKYGMVLDYE